MLFCVVVNNLVLFIIKKWWLKSMKIRGLKQHLCQLNHWPYRSKFLPLFTWLFLLSSSYFSFSFRFSSPEDRSPLPSCCPSPAVCFCSFLFLLLLLWTCAAAETDGSSSKGSSELQLQVSFLEQIRWQSCRELESSCNASNPLFFFINFMIFS